MAKRLMQIANAEGLKVNEVNIVMKVKLFGVFMYYIATEALDSTKYCKLLFLEISSVRQILLLSKMDYIVESYNLIFFYSLC